MTKFRVWYQGVIESQIPGKTPHNMLGIWYLVLLSGLLFVVSIGFSLSGRIHEIGGSSCTIYHRESARLCLGAMHFQFADILVLVLLAAAFILYERRSSRY